MFLNSANILVFFIVLARVIGLFTIAPFFSERIIPQMMKAIFILWITVVLWFVVDVPVNLPTAPIFVFTFMINEFLIGLGIGFIARIILVGIQTAGSLMDMQMGLSAAAIFDPTSGSQSTLMSKAMFYFGIIAFISINAHHLLLVVFRESFKVIPPVKLVEYSNMPEMLGELGARMFFIAVSLSLPIIIIIFLLDFSLGLLSRLAPQVNVFFLGFQIKPILGIWMFMLVAPVLGGKMSDLFYNVSVNVLDFYKLTRIIGNG